jgi:hypothetical protein
MTIASCEWKVSGIPKKGSKHLVECRITNMDYDSGGSAAK